MAGQHQSFFTYHQSRPYPFKWFTPLIIVIFILATVLFSLLNLVTTGYQITTEVTNDPNPTATGQQWTRELPSYLSSRIQASCQPAILRVEDLISTNKSALTYAVKSISQETPSGIRVLSATEYHSNVLGKCNISNIDINLESFDRALNQSAYNRWGLTVRTFLTCSLNNARGRIRVNLANEYNYRPSDISFNKVHTFFGTGFLTRNETTSPALWWGESMMSWYWPIQKVFLGFNHNYSTEDVLSPDHFTINGRVLLANDHLHTNVLRGTPGQLNADNGYPNIFIAADTLVKATYSTVLTDLGQTTATQNILTSSRLLTHFTANLSALADLSKSPVVDYGMYNSLGGPMNEPYKANSENDAIFSFDPSVINTSYLCQVSKIKSAGNLLVSIIIADLVFLQALWKILVFIVDTFILKDTSQHVEVAGHQSYSHLRSPSRDGYDMANLGPAKANATDFEPDQGSGRPPFQRQGTSQQYLLGNPS